VGFIREDGRHLAIGDARIWCGVGGDPTAPTLLLLHGGLGSVDDFDPLIPALAPRLRLVGIDSRGHGASSIGSEPLTYARLADDVEAVCAALGVEACDILGYSDGGIVGLRLAAAGWPRLRRLATIGATWRLTPDDPVRGLHASITPESWRAHSPAGYDAYHRLNPSPDFPGLIAAVGALWLDAGETGYPGDTVGRIACPVLLARGDRDELISRVESAELADRIAGAHLLNVPFAGHAVQAEAPELMAPLLLRFLSGSGGP
jgi:pimeloyl-ACP methyl ester carboxylesterase